MLSARMRNSSIETARSSSRSFSVGLAVSGLNSLMRRCTLSRTERRAPCRAGVAPEYRSVMCKPYPSRPGPGNLDLSSTQGSTRSGIRAAVVLLHVRCLVVRADVQPLLVLLQLLLVHVTGLLNGFRRSCGVHAGCGAFVRHGCAPLFARWPIPLQQGLCRNRKGRNRYAACMRE